MGVGIGSTVALGSHATFLELMPSFALIGVGGGLTTPLIATVLGVMPPDQAGVASALFNTSREVAGLLGITVIGVVVSSRENAVLARGTSQPLAFFSGYRYGLVVAAVLVAAGGLAAWVALRRAHAPERALEREVDSWRAELVGDAA
ncbi:MAG: MFS transporter, partial [Acidobacteriota bacterium]|nr:MFS transporter [Acidobacteriota bacterium]